MCENGGAKNHIKTSKRTSSLSSPKGVKKNNRSERKLNFDPFTKTLENLVNVVFDKNIVGFDFVVNFHRSCTGGLKSFGQLEA